MIDLNATRHIVKPQVKQWCDTKTNETPVEHIGALAIYTSCHIIAICYYVGELYGVTPELTKLLDKLQAFYREEIKGII